ncbi:malate permease [Spiroplasma clarkii]|nr:malate permease [Spiroplasma clarkii]
MYSLAFMIMSKKPMAATVDGKVSTKKLKSEMTEVEIAESRKIKKNALKNIFLNPILICTFIGLFIWVTQLIPGIDLLTVKGVEYKQIAGTSVFEKVDKIDKYSFLRIDILFPPAKTILSTLAGICTPLAWLAIGMTMAKGNLKEALKDGKLWYAASVKVIVAPLIILLMIVGVAGIGSATDWFTFSKVSLAVMVIMTAAPPANVVVAYAISYEKGANAASNLTTLSTLLSIITLPIWVIMVTAVGALPMFG